MVSLGVFRQVLDPFLGELGAEILGAERMDAKMESKLLIGLCSLLASFLRVFSLHFHRGQLERGGRLDVGIRAVENRLGGHDGAPFGLSPSRALVHHHGLS